MAEIELSAGVIEYGDTGGDLPVVVLLHGLLMDGGVWDGVVAELRTGYRCLTPTLPLGSHRRPMRPDADLSLLGQVGLVAEFLDRLDLADVTLVGNDWGGAALLVSVDRAQRVGRLVLTSCEAFDNFPPGLPGRAIATAARLPGGVNLAVQQLRIPALRRSPAAFGWMVKHPVPAATLRRWFRPAQTDRRIRRDLRAYVRATPPRAMLLELAERQRRFTGPVLVAWAAEDRVMPPAHGRRLAAAFPAGRLVMIPDSYTVIPQDQPTVLAGEIRRFLADTPPGRRA